MTPQEEPFINKPGVGRWGGGQKTARADVIKPLSSRSFLFRVGQRGGACHRTSRVRDGSPSIRHPEWASVAARAPPVFRGRDQLNIKLPQIHRQRSRQARRPKQARRSADESRVSPVSTPDTGEGWRLTLGNSPGDMNSWRPEVRRERQRHQTLMMRRALAKHRKLPSLSNSLRLLPSCPSPASSGNEIPRRVVLSDIFHSRLLRAESGGPGIIAGGFKS